MERARHELERVNLSPRDQGSNTYRDYQNAKLVADRHGGNPAVCATSLRAFRLEADYIAVRENLKANALMLNSFLLSGGLDTPSTMETMEMPATLH